MVKTINTSTKVSKRRELKFVWQCDGHTAYSGYGVFSKDLLTRLLKDGWTFAEIAFYSLHGQPITQDGWKVYPVMGHAFGSDALVMHSADFQANVAFTMQDVWPFDPNDLAKLKYFIPYAPIDKVPIPPAVIDKLRFAYRIITFSKFGQKALQDAGFTSTLIVEGTDPDIFKPMDKLEMRKQLGLPPDVFIFGSIAANKENPPRKGFQQMLDAFKLFSPNHPEARLFFHTQQVALGNFPIMEYANYLGFADKVFMMNPYIASYKSDSFQVAKELNAFDVCLHPSQTEGFGLVIAEAQSCGIPIIVNRIHCYDKETKIVTENGIKSFDEVGNGEKVWTLNGEQLELNEIERKYEYDFTGDMIRFKNNQFDLLVTPNHRIYYKKIHSKIKGYEVKSAKDFLLDTSTLRRFPMKGIWNGNGKTKFEEVLLKTNSIKFKRDLKSLIKLIGWYISEGCLDKSNIDRYNQIRISNTQNKFIKEIISIFTKLGIKSKFRNNTFKGVIAYNVELANFLQNFGTSKYSKRIGKEILSLPRTLLKELFITLMKGDGSKAGRKNWAYYATCSEQLKDNFIELTLKLGYSPKVIRVINNGGMIRGREIKGGELWKVYVRYNSKGLMSGKQITKEKYFGKVWCVQTKNHNLFIERNGKIVCSGNSMPELVKEGVTGEICEPDKPLWTSDNSYIYPANVNSLVDKMESIYKKLHEKNTIAKDCRDWVVENYNINTLVRDKWVPLLEELQQTILTKP